MIARHLGQQRRPRAQEARQRLHPRPHRGLGVQVHHGLAVAVQVQDDVGVDAQTQQRAAQALERAVFRQRGGALAQGGADQRDVVRRVAVQLAVDPLDDRVEQVGVVAVEVLAAGEIESALHRLKHALRQADRIGHRHQHDLAEDAPLGLEPGQAGAQVVGHQQPGNLVGVQRGLQRGLGAAAGRAVVQALEFDGHAGRVLRERVVDSFHVGFSLGTPRQRRSGPVAVTSRSSVISDAAPRRLGGPQ